MVIIIIIIIIIIIAVVVLMFEKLLQDLVLHYSAFHIRELTNSSPYKNLCWNPSSLNWKKDAVVLESEQR
jgi:hypothetical protein